MATHKARGQTHTVVKHIHKANLEAQTRRWPCIVTDVFNVVHKQKKTQTKNHRPLSWWKKSTAVLLPLLIQRHPSKCIRLFVFFFSSFKCKLWFTVSSTGKLIVIVLCASQCRNYIEMGCLLGGEQTRKSCHSDGRVDWVWQVAVSSPGPSRNRPLWLKYSVAGG